MSQPIFINKIPQFVDKNTLFKDMMLAHMAQDIEVHIKTSGRTPVKTGAMKADVRHRRMKAGTDPKYRVEANKNYSAVQELGRRAGSMTFRNYSTPGTGGGWFKEAINAVMRNKASYAKEASKVVGL